MPRPRRPARSRTWPTRALKCQAGTTRRNQVGVIQLIGAPHNGGIATLPIYNVVPEHGHPAEFGIFEKDSDRLALLYASIRGGPNYGCA